MKIDLETYRKSFISAISECWLSWVVCFCVSVCECLLEWMWIGDRLKNAVNWMVAPYVFPHGSPQKLRDAKNWYSMRASRSIAMLTPWFLISLFQNCDTINLCSFRQLVCVHLLQLAQETNTKGIQEQMGKKNGDRKFWQMVTNADVLKGQAGKVNDWKYKWKW